MSSEASASSSSGGKAAPKYVGNYAAWRLLFVAFMMRVGVKEGAYQRPIARWQEILSMLHTWEDTRLSDALSAELDGASPPPLKSASSSKEAAAPKADDSHRKAIRELVESSQKAYGYLFEALNDELRALVKGVPEGYAYGLWQFMEAKFQNTEQDNIADLYKRWNELAIGDDESFDSYKARVDEVNRLLEHAKDKPSPGQYAYVVLEKAAMLQPKLKPAVLALRVASAASGSGEDRFRLSDPMNTNWDEVVKFINSHERSENRMSDAQAERDHGIAAAAAAARSSQWNKSLSSSSQWVKTKSSGDIECHHCHEKGHIRPHCPRLLQDSQAAGRLVQQQHSSGAVPRPGSRGPTQKCSKCGAANHATKDHDESKVPMWRKNRAARAAAAIEDDGAGDFDEESLSERLSALEEAAKSRSANSDPSPGPKPKSAFANCAFGRNRFAVLGGAKEPEVEWASCALRVACSGVTQSSKKRAESSSASHGDHAKSDRMKLVRASQRSAPNSKSTAPTPVPLVKLMPEATVSSLKTALNSDSWGVDSMASVHICSNRSLFDSELKACSPVDVQVADGNVVRATLCGTITLLLRSAGEKNTVTTRCTLTGVLYHPDFSVNLLSWVKLLGRKWELHSSSEATYVVLHTGQRIPLTTSEGVLVLNAEHEHKKAAAAAAGASASIPPLITSNSRIASLSTAEDLVRVHEMMGHVGFDAMVHILKSSQTDGVGTLKLTSDDLLQARTAVLNCTACLKGKGSRTPFGHRGLATGKQPMEVLHMDSYQITRKGSAGQMIAEYGVVIDDRFSEMLYFVHTKTKDVIPQLITDLLQNVMTQSEKKLKRIICDGGTEFMNSTLKQWCQRHGVEMQPAPPKTPQLNGAAERHVRTLKEAARTLLAHCGLPSRFWGDATRHFVSTRNRFRIAAATGKTPHETVYGRRPSLQHLGVFGCDVYFHVPKQERRITMQSKMQPGIYLGYDWTHNCHRVYRLREHDIIATRDVRFRNSSFTHAHALRSGEVQQLLEGHQRPLELSMHDRDARLADVPEEEDEETHSDSGDEKVADDESPIPAAEYVSEEDHSGPAAEALRPPSMATRYRREQQQAFDEFEAARRLRDAAEQKAIDDALMAMSVRALVHAASSGMHQLEQQTPKTYREVLRHPRRDA